MAPWSPASESLQLSLAGAFPSDGRPPSVDQHQWYEHASGQLLQQVAGKINGTVGWSLSFTVAEQQTELGPQLSGVVATLRYNGPPVIFCLLTEE